MFLYVSLGSKVKPMILYFLKRLIRLKIPNDIGCITRMSPLCLHCLRNASDCSHAVIIITEQNSLLLTGQTAGFMGKNVLKTREFAVILGVWKVLAPLLHHLLNGVPAVSSWLEFVAGAYLLSHYMLYACASVKPLHSQITPLPQPWFYCNI